jgi:hypothetical protein
VVDHVEDNIETLLARLEKGGKKVKIMSEEEEAEEVMKQSQRDQEMAQQLYMIEQEKQILSKDKNDIANKLQEKEKKL